jgi:hypothetical protein
MNTEVGVGKHSRFLEKSSYLNYFVVVIKLLWDHPIGSENLGPRFLFGLHMKQAKFWKVCNLSYDFGYIFCGFCYNSFSIFMFEFGPARTFLRSTMVM